MGDLPGYRGTVPLRLFRPNQFERNYTYCASVSTRKHTGVFRQHLNLFIHLECN
jgi:hypothetical protein